MEQTLNELKSEALALKISTEKIYITTPASSETFALRAVNGIGIVDNLEQFNSEYISYNRKRNISFLALIIPVLLSIYLVFLYPTSSDGSSPIPTVIMFSIIGVIMYFILKPKKKPIMKSFFRIMLTGAVRDFEFYKKQTNSEEIAKFIAVIEDGLTSYSNAT